MIMFDKVDCSIDRSGILAESAIIQTQNSMDVIYGVGYRGVSAITPNGPIRSNFRLDYIPELDNEPSSIILSRLRNLIDDSSITGVTIEVGGITGFSCYLENYSLRSEPNSIVKASVNYVSFLPLSGSIHAKTGAVIYNQTDSIAHGWTTFITTTGGYLVSPTLGFNYNFDAQWEPIYNFGKTSPVQVNFMGAKEQISFVRGDFLFIKFSGENAYGTGTLVDSGINDSVVDLYNIAFHCIDDLYVTGLFDERFNALRFNISGAKVINTQMDAKIDDYLKSTTTIINYY